MILDGAGGGGGGLSLGPETSGLRSASAGHIICLLPFSGPNSSPVPWALASHYCHLNIAHDLFLFVLATQETGTHYIVSSHLAAH